MDETPWGEPAGQSLPGEPTAPDTGLRLPPSRFGPGYTVGAPPSSSAGAPPPASDTRRETQWYVHPVTPPADPHADFHRQTAELFGQSGPPAPGGGIGQNPPGPVLQPPSAAGAIQPPTNFTAPPPGPSAAPFPHTAGYPGGPPAGPYPLGHSDSDALVRRIVFIAGAVVIGIVLLLILRWFLVDVLFSGAGVILILLALFAGGGYLVYRNQNPDKARQLEAQFRHTAQTALNQATTTAKSVLAAPPSGPPGNPAAWGPNPAGSVNPAPPPPAFPVPAAAVPPPVTWPGPVPPPAVQPFYPGYAAATPTTGTDGSGAVVSALLLVPSLIVYGIVYSSNSFTSVWQPWWLITGLNVYFVVCAAARVRNQSRFMPTVLLGTVGTVLVALATSPSPTWSITAILSTTQSAGGYSYQQVPLDLLPWIVRLPVIATLLFVTAWGVSRRRQGSWVIGMVPAVLLVWLSIWWGEHHGISGPVWFALWLMHIGVFVGGCLACAMFDAMSGSRPQPAPPFPPRTW
jgi:hypothetical protein